MNVYLDSSVVLRKLQREPVPVPWAKWDRAYSSSLLRVEVLRTIDRNRFRSMVVNQNVLELLTEANAILDTLELINLSSPILTKASQPFPTPLGTLDAIHLATALNLAETRKIDLLFLTHDRELALAARAVKFEVQGV